MRTQLDDSLTLGEAIQQLRLQEDPDGAMTNAMSEVSAQAFEQHDAVHALFGCGTSIRDEIAAHVWMALATTARMGEMHRVVASQEHRKVLAGLGHVKLAGAWLASLPRLLRILMRSRQMERRIDFAELESLKRQSLAAIRREHGITLQGLRR